MMLRSKTTMWLVTALALVSAALLLVSYFYFGWGKGDQIWSNMIAELVMVLIIGVGAFFLGRHGVSLNSMQSENPSAIVSFYPEHAEADWASILRSAKRIDIVVHYYARWIRKYDDEFVRFFQRGGELRIVMADPEIPGVLSAVHEQFFANLTREQLVQKIEETEARLVEFFEQAGSRKARMLTYYFPQALHYSFVLVDSRSLYLSVYEQFRGPNVRSSVFGIDLRKDSELEEYWLANREAFIDGSRLGVEL